MVSNVRLTVELFVDFLDYHLAGFGFLQMSFDSPAKASNASTPTRPRTRSQCSIDDLGQVPERPDFSISSGDFGGEVGLPASFVQGK